MKESMFSALASDSSTDRAAHKQELVYTRTVRMGKSRTAFLGLQDLHEGTAVGILAAYKQVMLRAGLTVEEWISRVFWYCADGAAVMQSDVNGVAGLLMQLQRDVLGYSVLVPVSGCLQCRNRLTTIPLQTGCYLHAACSVGACNQGTLCSRTAVWVPAM